MRALRQVLKLAHAGLGAAAARTQELPSHRHDAFPRRRQEQLDRMVRRGDHSAASASGRMPRRSTTGAWRR
jgi:hypothetical protein